MPASVPFPRGVTEATFRVTAVDDSIPEEEEVLQIRFHSLPSLIQVGTTFGTDVHIRDDDAPTVNLPTTCDDQAGKTFVLNATGTISLSGEHDFWMVELDPWRVYIVEVLGADSGVDVLGEDTYSGNLTLADPELIGIWNADRSIRLGTYSLVARNGGNGRNSIAVEKQTRPGPFYFEVAGGDGGTETYQIKVRVNNVCVAGGGVVSYPWFGGPNGYDELDAPADTRTSRTLFTAPGLGRRRPDRRVQHPRGRQIDRVTGRPSSTRAIEVAPMLRGAVGWSALGICAWLWR